ncbi:MAG: hypothetical protein R2856_29195 [Caldilineaceae bacterium]
MSIMDFLDDYIMGPLNVIDHLEGFFSGIRYGDMGHQFAIPRVDKGGPMSLNEAEDLLNGWRRRLRTYTRCQQHVLPGEEPTGGVG